MYASYSKDEEGRNVERSLEKKIKSMSYSAEITNNLLVVGQTDCGKTSYVEKLLEGGFVKGNELVWISSETLNRGTREEYHKLFQGFDTFSFFQVRDKSDLKCLLNEIEPDIRRNNEENKLKTVIVFDDLLNIADKCDDYSAFLSTCRHIGVTTINMFQSFRNTEKWDNIKANCSTIVLFKLGWLSSRLINQITNVIGNSNRPVPKNSRWLYKVYNDNVLAKGDFSHLLIDLRARSESDLTCFRSQTDNKHVQTCYFDAGNQTDYNMFRSARMNNDKVNNLTFNVISVIHDKKLKSKDRLVTTRENKLKRKHLSDTDTDSEESSSLEEDGVTNPRKKIATRNGCGNGGGPFLSSSERGNNRSAREQRNDGEYYSSSSSSDSSSLGASTCDSNEDSIKFTNSSSRNSRRTTSNSSQYNRLSTRGRFTGRTPRSNRRPNYTIFADDRYSPTYV